MKYIIILLLFSINTHAQDSSVEYLEFTSGIGINIDSDNYFFIINSVSENNKDHKLGDVEIKGDTVFIIKKLFERVTDLNRLNIDMEIILSFINLKALSKLLWEDDPKGKYIFDQAVKEYQQDKNIIKPTSNTH